MFNPTTDVPSLSGWAGIVNPRMASRNVAFALWLECLVGELNREGVAITVDYLPGGTNVYFTLPDSAILRGADGQRILASITVMEKVANPVAWVRGKLRDSIRNREPVDE